MLPETDSFWLLLFVAVAVELAETDSFWLLLVVAVAVELAETDSFWLLLFVAVAASFWILVFVVAAVSSADATWVPKISEVPIRIPLTKPNAFALRKYPCPL